MLNKVVFENNASLNWCSIADVLQTSAIEKFNDTKLLYIAEAFRVVGNVARLGAIKAL